MAVRVREVETQQMDSTTSASLLAVGLRPHALCRMTRAFSWHLEFPKHLLIICRRWCPWQPVMQWHIVSFLSHHHCFSTCCLFLQKHKPSCLSWKRENSRHHILAWEVRKSIFLIQLIHPASNSVFRVLSHWEAMVWSLSSAFSSFLTVIASVWVDIFPLCISRGRPRLTEADWLALHLAFSSDWHKLIEASEHMEILWSGGLPQSWLNV